MKVLIPVFLIVAVIALFSVNGTKSELGDKISEGYIKITKER